MEDSWARTMVGLTVGVEGDRVEVSNGEKDGTTVNEQQWKKRNSQIVLQLAPFYTPTHSAGQAVDASTQCCIFLFILKWQLTVVFTINDVFKLKKRMTK